MSKAQVDHHHEEGIALTNTQQDRDALEYDDEEEVEDIVDSFEEEGWLTRCLHPFVNVIVLLHYHWIYNRLQFVLGSIATVMILLLVTGVVEKLDGPKNSLDGLFANHRDAHIRNIPYWTTINSKLDLKRDMIDHWCLDGSNNNCECADPFIPEAKFMDENWRKAAKLNHKAVKKAVQNKFEVKYSHIDEEQKDETTHEYAEERTKSTFRTLDVLFLGSSNTEARTGREIGVEKDDLKGIKSTFETQFQTNSSDYTGMALGIAGDTAVNLLWRIIHGGEVHPDMDPKVYWVSIGINDLIAAQCSEEVTLVGIINVVEELKIRKPNAFIVINSILPVHTGKDVLESNGKALGHWRSLSNINGVLHSFAKNTKKVKFFDGSKVFAKVDDGNLCVRGELYADNFHLNRKGQKMWGKAQIDFLHDLIQTPQEETENTVDDMSNFRYYDDPLADDGAQ